MDRCQRESGGNLGERSAPLMGDSAHRTIRGGKSDACVVFVSRRSERHGAVTFQTCAQGATVIGSGFIGPYWVYDDLSGPRA